MIIPFSFWKPTGFNPDDVPGLSLWWDFGDENFTEYLTTGNLNVRTIIDKKNPSIQATFNGTGLNRFAKITEGTLPNGQPRIGLGYNSANRDNITFGYDVYGNVWKNVAQHHVFWAGRVINYVNNRRWMEIEGSTPTLVTRAHISNLSGVDADNGRFRFRDIGNNGTAQNWDERYPTPPLTDGITTRQVAYKGGAGGAGNLAGSPPLLPASSTDVRVRIGTINTNRLVQNSVVHEVLVYLGVMTEQDKDKIIDYLRNKWGI
jgi:hypothetical protein